MWRGERPISKLRRVAIEVVFGELHGRGDWPKLGLGAWHQDLGGEKGRDVATAGQVQPRRLARLLSALPFGPSASHPSPSSA